MKTINRSNSRYRPTFNTEKEINYIFDESLTNLIKRVDEYCVRYGYDYAEPIYKVVESENTKTMMNTSVRLKSNKTRYKGNETSYVNGYEAKLRKVELV